MFHQCHTVLGWFRAMPAVQRVRAARTLAIACCSAALLLGGLIMPFTLVASSVSPISPVTSRTYCDRLGGSWNEAIATCIVDSYTGFGGGLTIPAGVTVGITNEFLNDATIVGPGPGVLMIEDVIIDGHLVISGTALNYGPVLVNGFLTVTGQWTDESDSRYACDPIRMICVASEAIGAISNHGVVSTSGALFLGNGLINDGEWYHVGRASVDSALKNRGQIENSGRMTSANTLWNIGDSHHAGSLVNTGTLINWGRLTGTVENSGTIYAINDVSATIEGTGVVYLLRHDVYAPHVQ